MLFVVGTLVVAGCNVGQGSIGSNGDADKDKDGNGVPDSGYAVTLLSQDQDLALGEMGEYAFEISSDNYAGPVSLAATGIPESWNVSFDPSNTVVMGKNEKVIVTMMVEVPTVVATTNVTVGVESTSDLSATAVAADATSSVAVDDSVLKIFVDPGTAADAHPSFQRNNIEVKLGTAVQFVNNDDEVHQVHAGAGDAGFPHGGPIPPGTSEDERIITEIGTFPFYCHTHGKGVSSGSITTIP